MFVFSIDSTSSSSSPAPGVALYHSPETFTLTLGSSYTVDTSSPALAGNLSIEDGLPDQFQQNLQAFGSATFPPDLGGYRLVQIVTTLHNADGTALSGTGLPTSLDIADWGALNHADIIFRDPNDPADQRSVSGTFTQMGVAVPEPGLGLLAATALLLAAATRRRF